MAIRVSLHHKTSYRYARPVTIHPHTLRLKPAAHSRTPIISYSLRVEPADHFMNWQQDPSGNYLSRLVFPEKSDRLEVIVDLVAELHTINPFDFFLEPFAEQFPFEYPAQLKTQLEPYLRKSESGPLLEQYVKQFQKPKMQTSDYIVAVNQQLQQDVKYEIRMEPGVHTCEETLQLKSGSCRDSAYLLVQILRGMGLAARFVSGYLIQLVPDEIPREGPVGPSTDFTDLHAWAEVYLPGAGWIGLDATSGLLTAEGHIPLACTAEPIDAAAITGSVEPCESKFEFAMDIKRIEETPRVTKPYTEDQWKEIYMLGQVVDFSLEKHDIRLTLGGEPTFVSEKNRDAPEWNMDSDGPEKKPKSRELALALREKFAPGSSFHSGQGKWYPGEELPRWAFTLFFRNDGVPIWKNADLFADETKDYKFTIKDAEKFILSLSDKLIGTRDTIATAYEDIYYALWKEGNLPTGVDIKSHDLRTVTGRKTLRGLLEGDIGEPTGYILPLQYHVVDHVWVSHKWHFEREKLYLLPGDSPLGYRLPLDRLKGIDPGLPQLHPMAMTGTLPDIDERIALRRKKAKDKKPEAEVDYAMRTAVCVECRNGKIYVFLPPHADTASYLELIHCIEETASELKMPILVEGYEPGVDPRMSRFAVTPDPGVIEVNIHHSLNWKEICSKLNTLYDVSRAHGLTAEKFMLDGRRTGTGGGNHITLGGVTPVDSPFLRRPDLLRSFITYFQHHPCLSYFFSGLYVGPTSQAPRIDETNPESLYELAIAFEQLPVYAVPEPDDQHSAWLLDRLLRNLLIDRTGNTHRTEICIDKLHSPGSLSGRLGIVEFRGFEMPYHAQMNALQCLLLRSLVAHFWQKPYERSPIVWGNMLHDKYRLPGYLWEDLTQVIAEVGRSGFHFAPEWFLPFLESRFPLAGKIQIGEMTLELRTALEAWNVLGEEILQGGTARAVDSAVERLQVKVTQFHPERYVLLCNGRAVPLQPTASTGTYLAGIRFKAWNLPRTLHPSLPINSPLFFDLYDRHTGATLGGCTYHVYHPGGRAYETAPVNEREAETRVLSRFFPGGGYPEPVFDSEFNPYYPCTLDLRKSPESPGFA